MNNKILTMGFGARRLKANNSGPITVGYGPKITPSLTLAEIYRSRIRGRSAIKHRDELKEVFIMIKLIEVNSHATAKEIKKSIKALLDDKICRINVERLQHKVVRSKIKVVAERIRR